MKQFNFPEDQWQHVGDEDDVTFDMQLWIDDLTGNKYATFCPVKPVVREDGTPDLNDDGDQYVTTDLVATTAPRIC